MPKDHDSHDCLFAPHTGSVLVLGATGLLGQTLVPTLRSAGWKVAGVARGSFGKTDFSVDVTDDSVLESVLDRTRPNWIINAAAMTDLAACESDPAAAYRINTRLPGLLAAHSDERDFRLIQISTDHYYTGDGNVCHAETAPVMLINEYARTKYAGEALALTARNTLVLRTNIVGFRGNEKRPTLVEWALDRLVSRREMTLIDDFFTSSLDVRQFSELLLELLSRPVTGLLNLASRDVASKRTFITSLATALGLGIEQCSTGSIRTLAGPRRAESLGLDVGRAEALLGHPLPSLSDTISSLVTEYREHNVCVT